MSASPSASTSADHTSATAELAGGGVRERGRARERAWVRSFDLARLAGPEAVVEEAVVEGAAAAAVEEEDFLRRGGGAAMSRLVREVELRDEEEEEEEEEEEPAVA